jgi:hypothetical protein
MAETLGIKDTPIFTYTLASADLRYIEIGEREIYIYQDPDKGWVFRGEVPGCGSACDADLSEILLEYAMSCEGCRDNSIASTMVSQFGTYLGKSLAGRVLPDIEGLDPVGQLSYGFKCILNSGKGNFIEESSTDRLAYSLDCCPLSECASKTGFNRSVEIAHFSFTALCKGLANSLAPDWELLEPSENSTNTPIHKLIIAGPQVS